MDIVGREGMPLKAERGAVTMEWHAIGIKGCYRKAKASHGHRGPSRDQAMVEKESYPWRGSHRVEDMP